MGMLDDFVGALDIEKEQEDSLEEIRQEQELAEKKLKTANLFMTNRADHILPSELGELYDAVKVAEKEIKQIKRDFKAMKWKSKRRLGKK